MDSGSLWQNWPANREERGGSECVSDYLRKVIQQWLDKGFVKGDFNSRYFHSCLRARTCRNQLLSVNSLFLWENQGGCMELKVHPILFLIVVESLFELFINGKQFGSYRSLNLGIENDFSILQLRSSRLISRKRWWILQRWFSWWCTWMSLQPLEKRGNSNVKF